VEIRETNLALVENGTVRGEVPLVTGKWLELVFTYTKKGEVTLKLDGSETALVLLQRRGHATRLDFGLLSVPLGRDLIFFDDVELTY